jgi:hypothetical protein
MHEGGRTPIGPTPVFGLRPRICLLLLSLIRRLVIVGFFMELVFHPLPKVCNTLGGTDL